jgi:hypothetical protein
MNFYSYLTIFVSFQLLGTISRAQVVPGIQVSAYFQEIKTEIRLPTEAGPNVIKLFQTPKGIAAVTSKSVYKYLDGKWIGHQYDGEWRTAAQNSEGQIWFASVRLIQKEGDPTKIELPDFAKSDTIISLFCENDQTLQIGTNNGLISWDGHWSTVPFTKGKRINAIAKDKKGDLWLATNDGLLRRMAGKWINMDDALMAYGLKRHYFALESGGRNDEMLFSGLFTVGCIAENGDNWLLRGADGLPYGPVTSIHSSENCMWLGTARGAIKKESSWHYYNGKRWLPNNKVNDILPVDERTTWIATPEGISQIQEVTMTLDQKAKAFEERIRLRHVRHGLVSRSKLLTPGDLSTSKTENNDNDGLWTSIYLAAECFRWGATKDPEAMKNALRTYEALERLETVTGISGLPARSFAAATDTVIQSRSPHPKIWHPSPDGKWQWLDDASSDEIAGHLFAISVFYELVADSEMKVRIRNLVHRIMTHIVDNNFQLIDFDGLPTKWAIWNPDSLNNIPGRWYERGLNSLQMLTFLKVAVYITKDQKFEKAYQMLIQKHHYAENTLQAKMSAPYENSHSDDILTYLPYYTLFRYSKDLKSYPVYTRSLERAWKVAQPERTPLWNIIASVSLKKDCDLTIAAEELQLIPMDMITWTMENSHRWDLPEDQLHGRSGEAQSVRPIPTPEAGIIKANSNPRQYDSGPDGDYEDDGAYFLLPYWMGRYHRLLIEK